MSETKKNEVAVKQTSFSDALELTLTENRTALPANFNIPRFVQNGLALLNGNDTLQKYAREHGTAQIKNGMMRAAILNLDFMNKECYLIPYGANINFMLDYRGCKKLAKLYSVRPIKDVVAEVVRHGDVFESGIDKNVPYVTFNPQPFNDGEIIGAFAYIIYEDGGTLVETMSKKEIEVCRSKSKQSNSMPWKDFYSEMAKKTVLHRIFKRVELNFENAKQQEIYVEDTEIIDTDIQKQVENEIANEANKVDFIEPEIIDGEVTEVDGQQQSLPFSEG